MARTRVARSASLTAKAALGGNSGTEHEGGGVSRFGNAGDEVAIKPPIETMTSSRSGRAKGLREDRPSAR